MLDHPDDVLVRRRPRELAPKPSSDDAPMGGRLVTVDPRAQNLPDFREAVRRLAKVANASMVSQAARLRRQGLYASVNPSSLFGSSGATGIIPLAWMRFEGGRDAGLWVVAVARTRTEDREWAQNGGGCVCLGKQLAPSAGPLELAPFSTFDPMKADEALVDARVAAAVGQVLAMAMGT